MPQMSLEQYIQYLNHVSPGISNPEIFYQGYSSGYVEGESPGLAEWQAVFGAGIGAGAWAREPILPPPGDEVLMQPGSTPTIGGGLIPMNGSVDVYDGPHWTDKYRQQLIGGGGMPSTVPEYVDGALVIGPYSEWPPLENGGGETQDAGWQNGQYVIGGQPYNIYKGVAPMMLPSPAGALQVAKSAALSVSVGAGTKAAISGSALLAFIQRFGATVAKVIFGALAVKEVSDMAGMGLGEALAGLTILWNPSKKMTLHKKRRYTFSMNSRIGTVAKSAKAMKRVLRRHEKVIRAFLPRRTVYGQAPSSMLSTVEKRAMRRK